MQSAEVIFSLIFQPATRILPMAADLDENLRLSAETARILLDIPPRVARIETHIEYIRGDIAELKASVAGLRSDMTGEFKSVGADFNAVRAEAQGFREAMHTEFKSVGAQFNAVRAEAQGFREAMHTEFKLVYAEFKAVRAEAQGFREAMHTEFKLVYAEFKAVRAEMRAQLILLFGALIAVALGLSGLMAKGFHWIG